MSTFVPRPDLLAGARELVIQHQIASKSLLQRHLGIGFSVAVDLLARLHEQGVVTPVLQSGIRLIAPSFRRPYLEPASARDRHIRMLRDLALYMLESREEGGDGHSEFIKQLLADAPTSVQTDWTVIRRVSAPILADRPDRPVWTLAFQLALLPALSEMYEGAALGPDLAEACAPLDRAMDGHIDDADRQRRSFVRIARYFEMRILQGREPDTQVLIWLPFNVPSGSSAQNQIDGSKPHKEHVVPRRLLAQKAMELLRSGVPVTQVAMWMAPFNAIVEITQAERDYLDHVRRWKETMPPGWEFDRDSIYARLIQAEIPFTMGNATNAWRCL